MMSTKRREGPRRREAAKAALAAACLLGGPALAQSYLTFPATLGAAMPDADAFATKYSSAPASPFVADDPFYSHFHAGLWTIYPLVQSAIRYDDNILGTRLKPIADGYLQISPSIAATRSNGVHSTLVYGALDANHYFDVAKADHVNFRAGFEQIWEARRDLVLTATGDLTRASDLDRTGAPLAQGGFFPVSATTLRGSLSLMKTFRDFFFRTSLVASAVTYGQASTEAGVLSDQGYRDYNEYLLIQRAGYSPAGNANVFEETTLSKQDLYRSRASSSTGVRQVLGAGVAQEGVLSGEVFAGAQERAYNAPAIGTVWQPVWGGALTWRPTPYLNLTLSHDQLIETTGSISPVSPQIGLMKAQDTVFGANYALARDWRAGLSIKYENDAYIDSPERDRTLFLGLEFDYAFSRSWLFSCGVQRLQVWSNIADLSYVKDVTSASASYRY